MDVKEFVAETLKQVTEAVKENSSTLKNGHGYIDELKKLNMFSHGNGFVTYVDFDIAVTESSSKEGGAKLSVAGIGALGGDLTEGTEVASKVKFRVPIQIDGL
ncbi:hypothetical protein A9267_20770 [Shewanella sp. UCD-FRSSP16_17]|uniref:hypothetical protein n=1 Tax=Shewanella sp. UCD-FRSSP16_17 TaxID=1853256 RepID=UPI0007EEA7D6|nr:hypothetical protein [Shewanella sp. UCD-FRSSP16_17]OBT09583.1 hypothetical protein A9267_20770 [Shewanella sp. UCD-FRSSP16_17]